MTFIDLIYSFLLFAKTIDYQGKTILAEDQDSSNENTNFTYSPHLMLKNPSLFQVQVKVLQKFTDWHLQIHVVIRRSKYYLIA